MSMQALRSMIADDPAVADLVGERVTPHVRTIPPLPAIMLSRIGGAQELYVGGPLNLTKGLYQVDLLAATQEALVALAKRVRPAINGVSGVFSAVSVESCRILDERDTYEEPTAGRSRGLFRRVLDVRVWFQDEG